MATSITYGYRVPDIGLPLAESTQYWFAIYTRSRHEKVVTTALQQRGVTSFLPIVSQARRWSDRTKTVDVPLFPGYTFVRTPDTPEALLRVLMTPGVVEFVGSGRRGTTIPDKQIEDLQTLLKKDVRFAMHPFLRIGQRVRVRGGCLDGIEGLLTAVNGNKSLVISLESMPHSIAICIDGFEVEILSSRADA
jgi:transcriptional antiterminator NusG